ALEHRRGHGGEQQRERQPVEARVRPRLRRHADAAGTRALDLPHGRFRARGERHRRPWHTRRAGGRFPRCAARRAAERAAGADRRGHRHRGARAARRFILGGGIVMRILLGTVLAAVWTVSTAQPYPAKPIHLLVAFPPGGPVDIIARLVAPKMSETLGQSIVVENKVGASGNVATAEVAKSAPDGYTLLAHSSAYAVNPTLFSHPGYDPVKDLQAVAVVAQQANIILVNSSFPAKTLDELHRAMEKDKLAFAPPGARTTPHLTA